METMTLTRALAPEDFQEVIEIEQFSYDDPWQYRDISEYYMRDNHWGIVATDESLIQAFAWYSVEPVYLRLWNIAAHPDSRREGYATRVIEDLKLRLNIDCSSGSFIVADVRETNLNALLFFQSNEFKCVKILPDHYDDGENCYLMRFDK